MENRAHALLAGLFTLLMLAVVVVLAIWLNRERVQTRPYQLSTSLSIAGLNPKAAVRFRGLKIGTVEAIDFDPKAPSQILIDIGVEDDAPITRSTYATLGYQGITGIAFLQLDDDGRDPRPLASSNAHIARLELRPGLLDQLQQRGLAILQQTQELSTRMNQLLAPENQQIMRDTLTQITRAAAAVEALPLQLKPTLELLPGLARETRQTVASIHGLSLELRQLSAGLQAPQGSIQQLNRAVEDVADAAKQITTEVPPLVKEFRQTARTVNHTVEGLGQQSLGTLLRGTQIPPGPGEAGFPATTKDAK